MLESGGGRPVWLCGRGDDPELALNQWIMATIMLETFAGERIAQLPPARLMRVLLLMQEMEGLVHDLRAVLQGDCEKNVAGATQGIVTAPVCH